VPKSIRPPTPKINPDTFWEDTAKPARAQPSSQHGQQQNRRTYREALPLPIVSSVMVSGWASP